MSMLEVEKYQHLLDISQQYKVLYKQEREKFPFRINVIEELHDNENAHSRILLRILKYTNSGRFTWLCSFINRMNKLCEGSFQFEISKPVIENNVYTGDGFIDCLILENNKYAIIVENKIWDAVDQNVQIEKYVKFIIEKCHFAQKNIFVIYLTKDGTKNISDISLSEETKKELGVRFIQMNYKEDILHWLEEDIFPSCKEKGIESAIYQYIDYLKGVFGHLNYHKQAQKKALNQIFHKMGITNNIREISKLSNEVNTLAKVMEDHIYKIGFQQLENFHKITQDFFKNKEIFDLKKINQKDYSKGYYQICDTKWEKITNLYPHLEWVPLKYSNLIENTSLNFVLHIEGLSEKVEKCAKIILEKGKNLNYIKKHKEKNTLFEIKYSLNGKTFAEMSDVEKRTFLHEIYASDTIQTIIKLMNETIAEMKQQQENK